MRITLLAIGMLNVVTSTIPPFDVWSILCLIAASFCFIVAAVS